jgi:hypothetical protein
VDPVPDPLLSAIILPTKKKYNVYKQRYASMPGVELETPNFSIQAAQDL